ncbi:hypothetical protein N7492_004850 [Penicillium capsulatum]|uniref:Uncharacterized protein n=1 Tax=Penicillium capsulatum TaxID=69766 RepID=A0A9W9LQL2_9EURO|nr:hypothetical protein N7492_004850 [Penicillium capsulatum]KAJ6136041.1 hypothetical protein N7512_001201 [Penicillium capsulatum]
MALVPESTSVDLDMSIKTVYLEKEYERTLAESARLIDAERDRARRMENLLLQFESNALRSQLDQAHAELLGLTQSESETLIHLDKACREIARLDHHARTSSNEIERLKDEISNSNSTSLNYNSLLAEKVQLSRELASLKTELARLKTQNASDQALITGTHELERQLNSLEVQLDHEKHAHERARVKCTQQSTEISRLSSNIDELQGALAKEQRAAQHLEREIRQQSTGWDSQRAVLEAKIETLKKQLRSAKEKLQEAQHDLQQRHIGTRTEVDAPGVQSRAVPIPRSDSGSEHHSGVTIATPGAVRVQEKVKRSSALPGDKSAFSITPYLNRTGAARDSPVSSDVDETEVNQAVRDTHTSISKARAMDVASSAESPLNERPVRPRDIPAKGTKVKATESKGKGVVSAASNEPRQPPRRSAAKVPAEDPEDSLDPFLESTQAKPKRRKLGAQRDRNLFDNEDEEDIFESRKPGRKLALGSRNSALATTQTGALTGDRPPKPLGFAAFSPLKRDRKR